MKWICVKDYSHGGKSWKEGDIMETYHSIYEWAAHDTELDGGHTITMYYINFKINPCFREYEENYNKNLEKIKSIYGRN